MSIIVSSRHCVYFCYVQSFEQLHLLFLTWNLRGLREMSHMEKAKYRTPKKETTILPPQSLIRHTKG